MENREEKQIWTTGRKGQMVCITVEEHDNGVIIVSALGEAITNAQLRRALQREYPRHTFYSWRDADEFGLVYAQADPVSQEEQGE